MVVREHGVVAERGDRAVASHVAARAGFHLHAAARGVTAGARGHAVAPITRLDRARAVNERAAPRRHHAVVSGPVSLRSPTSTPRPFLRRSGVPRSPYGHGLSTALGKLHEDRRKGERSPRALIKRTQAVSPHGHRLPTQGNGGQCALLVDEHARCVVGTCHPQASHFLGTRGRADSGFVGEFLTTSRRIAAGRNVTTRGELAPAEEARVRHARDRTELDALFPGLHGLGRGGGVLVARRADDDLAGGRAYRVVRCARGPGSGRGPGNVDGSRSARLRAEEGETDGNGGNDAHDGVPRVAFRMPRREARPRDRVTE